MKATATERMPRWKSVDLPSWGGRGDDDDDDDDATATTAASAASRSAARTAHQMHAMVEERPEFERSSSIGRSGT